MFELESTARNREAQAEHLRKMNILEQQYLNEVTIPKRLDAIESKLDIAIESLSVLIKMKED